MEATERVPELPVEPRRRTNGPTLIGGCRPDLAPRVSFTSLGTQLILRAQLYDNHYRFLKGTTTSTVKLLRGTFYFTSRVLPIPKLSEVSSPSHLISSLTPKSSPILPSPAFFLSLPFVHCFDGFCVARSSLWSLF